MKKWLKEKINARKGFNRVKAVKLSKRVSFGLIVIILIPLFLFFYLWVTRKNQWFICVFRFLLGQLGFDSQMVLENMVNNAGFLGNSVWMMATILSGAVIFYCSLLGYKSYGIPNRQLIAYSAGSWSLPLLVASTFVMVLLMTSAYYTSYFTLFYFWAVYSLMPQVIAYIYCMRYCSRKQCFRIILKVEGRQYKWLQKKLLSVSAAEEYSQKDEEAVQIRNNEVCEKLIFHTQLVMSGEETLEEKMELIQKILFVPFSRYEYRCAGRQKDLQGIYLYIYQNVKRVLQYSSEVISDFEADQFYFMIYENIKKIERIYDEEACRIDLGEIGDFGEKQTDEYPLYWEKLAVYLSAVFHAVLPERNMRNRWKFVLYIVNDLIAPEEEKRLVIGVLLCSIEYLGHRGLLDINPEGNVIPGSGEDNKCINDYVEIEECLELLYLRENWSVDDYILEKMFCFMRIWFSGTTEAKNFWKLFYQIQRSMEGKSSKAVIAYFLRNREGGHNNE